MLLVAAAASLVVLFFEWLAAAFSDVDRSDPTCPSSMKRALRLRWERLERDVKKNWFLFKRKQSKNKSK